VSGRKNYNVTAGEVEREIRRNNERVRNEWRSALNGLEKNVDRRINQQRKELKKTEKKLTNQYNKLRHEFQEAEKRRLQDVKNLSDRIESARVEAKNYTDQEVQAVWDEMARKAENEKSFAEDALAALEYSFAEMENLQCQKYKPDKHRDYQNHLTDIKNNIASELYNPAIASAQSAYRESFTIRENLEELSNKGIELNAAIEEKKAMLKDLMDKQKLIKQEYETSDHNREKITVDLSFWAGEEWEELVSNFETLEKKHGEVARFVGGDYLAGLEDLNKYSEKLIEDFFALKNEGLNRHFASVATMDRQEDIYRSLSKSGFEIVDNFFEDEDERKANILMMENAEGEKIMIRVVPEEENQDIKVSFSSLYAVTRDKNLQALNEIIGVDPVAESGYENKPAPEEDFDVKKYGRKKKKL